MARLHELLKRDLDPIDDVCHRFEEVYMAYYYHPLDGDWISDDYRRIIDLTTQPQTLDQKQAAKLNRSINRLNQKKEHLYMRLGDSSLVGAYNSVAEQVNSINSADLSRREIGVMEPLVAEVVA